MEKKPMIYYAKRFKLDSAQGDPDTNDQKQLLKRQYTFEPDKKGEVSSENKKMMKKLTSFNFILSEKVIF